MSSKSSSKSKSKSKTGSKSTSKSRSKSFKTTDEFVEFTFPDTKRKLGIVLKNTYPIINKIDKGSYADELKISDDLEITIIGDIPAPPTMKEAIGIFKSEKTRLGENFKIQFRLPIDDPNFDWMSVVDTSNSRKIICSSNYVKGINEQNLDTKLSGVPLGENMGTYEDNYTLNPRTVGYEGIPGEVLFIPREYPFYKGVGGEGGTCYDTIDVRASWYGDKETADIYAGPSNKMMVFRATRPIVLMNLLDPVNIDWMLGRLNKFKEDGRIDSEKHRDFTEAIKSALMNRIRNLKNIVGLQNGTRRALSNRLLTEYMTYCGKKYGPRDMDSVINRYSAGWYDFSLPEILSLVFDKIHCDGYFADAVPGQNGIFPREIMIINSVPLMKIDFDNPLHTCPGSAKGALRKKKTKTKRSKKKGSKKGSKGKGSKGKGSKKGSKGKGTKRK